MTDKDSCGDNDTAGVTTMTEKSKASYSRRDLSMSYQDLGESRRQTNYFAHKFCNLHPTKLYAWTFQKN